jgi:hypothetical protein
MNEGQHVERISSVAETLESNNEELADVCSELLRSALEGDASAQRIERSVQRARRAIAKAEQILREVSRPQGD